MKTLAIFLIILAQLSIPYLVYAQGLPDSTNDNVTDQFVVQPAQEQTINPSSQILDVVLSADNQSPRSKEFDLIAEITSNLDSDRVIVEWILPAEVEFVDGSQPVTENTTVSNGSSRTETVRVKPLAEGTFEIKVNVTAVKADVNYLTSDEIQAEFNSNKEIIPMADQYKQDKLVAKILDVLIYLVIIVSIGVVAILGYREYKKFLAS